MICVMPRAQHAKSIPCRVSTMQRVHNAESQHMLRVRLSHTHMHVCIYGHVTNVIEALVSLNRSNAWCRMGMGSEQDQAEVASGWIRLAFTKIYDLKTCSEKLRRCLASATPSS